MVVIRRIRSIIVMICLLLSYMVLPAEAQEAVDTEAVIQYISLGDSIAKGYTYDKSELASYPVLVQDHIKRELAIPVELTNTAKNGLSTFKLNENILSDAQVTQTLSNADLVTVTIGANDLMDEFKSMCQEILGRSQKFKDLDDALELLNEEVKSRPTLVFKVIGALSNWDYETFEGNWVKSMESISLHKKDSVQVVATNIYNPVEGLDLPETITKVTDSIIKKMNGIIDEYAEVYNYKVVDLFHSDISKHVQVDGLHPNQEGQQLIAAAVIEKVDMTVWGGKNVKQVDENNEGSIKSIVMEPKVIVENDKKENNGSIGMAGFSIACMGITGVLLIILGLKKVRKNK